MTSKLPGTEKWLVEELKRREADVDVFVPYLLALLTPEETPESVEHAATELLTSVVSDPTDAASLSHSLVEKWLEESPAIATRKEVVVPKARSLGGPTPQAEGAAPASAPAPAMPSRADKKKEKKKKAKKAAEPAVEEEEHGTKEESSHSEIVLQGDLAYFASGDTLFTGHRMTLMIEDTLILDNGQLALSRGHRYGLLGPNGAGKTTLLNALRNELAKRGAHGVFYVGQTDGERLQLEARGSSLSLLEHVMSGDERTVALRKEAAALNLKPTLGPEDAERLGEIMAEIESDSGQGEAQARMLLERLGFVKTDRPVSELSGGWRSRLEIARALWAKTDDVLMLDEPTNHMDLAAILQLAGILREDSKRTLVVVSHDAAFLDLVCTDTICLYSGTLKQFDGNYSAFEEYVQQQRTFHTDINEAREKKEAALKHSIVQQRQRAARSQDSAAQRNAASREKKIERVGLYREDGKHYKLRSLKTMDASAVRLPLRAEPVRDGKGVNMKLPSWMTPADPSAEPPSADAPPLLETTPLLLGPHWGVRGRPLLRTPPLSVAAGDRVAIVGANGCGKTTLIRALAGALQSDVIADGSVRTSGSVAIVDQNQLAALDGDMDSTPLEWIIKRLGAEGRPRPEEEARKHLSCFAIGQDAAETPISELSGGLRVRLLLAGVFVGSPRVLLLDEPSNHLDAESILAFVELCRVFPGAIIGISHNIAFLLQVFHDLWLIDNGVLTVHKTRTAHDFVEAFGNYATPLVGSQHRAAFLDMLRIRVARSTLVVQSESTTTGLIVI